MPALKILIFVGWYSNFVFSNTFCLPRKLYDVYKQVGMLFVEIPAVQLKIHQNTKKHRVAVKEEGI